MWSQCMKLPAYHRVWWPRDTLGLLKPIEFSSKMKQNKLLDPEGCFAVACLIFLQLVDENNRVEFAGPVSWIGVSYLFVLLD